MTTPCRFPLPRLHALALMLGAALGLAACGGGGGDASPDTTAATAADTATTATTTTTASTTSTGDAGTSADASNGTPLEAQALAYKAQAGSVLVLKARGSLLNGTGPIVQVLVKGRLVATTEVHATSYQNYSFNIPSMSRGGRIDVVYVNDEAVGGVDRNLWLQSITVDGTVIPASSAVYDQGSGSAAFDGANTAPGQEAVYWNGALRFKIADGGYAFTGTGVFVDQVAGNDANSGSQAAPWKTLAKVASSARLKSGQGVYLRCGQVWRESLSLNATQLVDGVTVSGYGSNCATVNAVISGANDFSGSWTKSGNIWSRAVPAGTPKISRLFVNGVSQMTARWPNQPDSGEGYALVAANAVSSSNAIKVASTDLAALSGRDLASAVVSVRDIAWKIENFNVASYDAGNGVLNLASNASYSIDAGEGYVLQDKLWMLDAPGEFFHDTVNNKLYVYPSDAGAQSNLNMQLVEGSVRDVPLALAARNWLTVRSISAQMGRGSGITLNNAPAALIDAVDASHNGGSGISVVQDTAKAAATIQNSTVSDNWLYGIDAQYAGGITISGNVVSNTGNIGNPGWTAAAIHGGDGAKILNNIVDGSGYHGIRFSGVGGSQVTGNTVTRHCLRLSDCGGIYTWNGYKLQGNSQYAGVSSNQVLAGTPNTEGAVGPGSTVMAGIYLDDFSYGVTVRSNMVFGTSFGLFIHNASNNTLDSNGIWAPAQAGIVANMDQTDRDWMTGNQVKNNQLVPMSSARAQFPAPPVFNTPQPIWFFDGISGGQSLLNGVNVFSGNQVIRLNTTTDDIHAWIRSNTADGKLNSRQWQSLIPADGATRQPLSFALYSLTLGQELVPGGTFDNGVGNWTSYFNPSGTGGSLRSDSGKAGCTGNCISLTVGTVNDYAASPSFTMKAGAAYLFSYSATLGADATLHLPYIGQVASPWGSMAASGYSSANNPSGTAGQVINYQSFFTAISTDLARVNMQLSTVGVPVSFDNVSVREIQSYAFAKTSDWAAVAYAPSGASTTVTCGSLGWDDACTVAAADGTPISLPQTLSGGSAQLYVRTNSTWRR